MIHVILIILKILGIIILILLGIILLALLLILFVPVKVKISGYYKKEKSDVYVKLDVSWLFKTVLYRLLYHGGIQEKSLKIFGRKPGGHKRTEKKKEKPDTHKPDEKTESRKTEAAVKTKQDISSEKTEEKSAAKDPGTEKKKFENNKKENNIKNEDSVKGDKKSFFTVFTDKIRKIIKNIKIKVTGFIKRITDIKDFIEDEENILALNQTLKSIKKLLIHMRPRKAKISGILGFDDPCTTGQVFGIIGVLASYYGKSLDIKADFEKEVIDIVFDIRGHLMVSYALIIVLKLMTNKRLREWVLKK